MSLDLTLFVLGSPKDLGKVDSPLSPRFTLELETNSFSIYPQLIDPSRFGYEPSTPTINPRTAPRGLTIVSPVADEEDITENGGSTASALTYVYADELSKVVMAENTDILNRAIWALLRGLPGDLPVVLYWH